MWIFWLIIIILLIILEVITINFVSIWFVLSGLISLISSFFLDSFYIEFAIFISLGLVIMLLIRPILVKKTKKNVDIASTLGKEGKVVKEITKFKVGSVLIDKTPFEAISDTKIKIDRKIVVEGIEDDKLVVREVK